MSGRVKMNPIPRLVFDTSSLTTGYQTMDADGLANEVQIFKMINDSTVAVDVSFDGLVDHEYIPAGGAFILDLTANAEGDLSAFSLATQIFLKGSGAGVGNVYAIGYSQRRQ